MISVLIPFRSDDTYRQRSFEWVKARWQSLLPDAEIVIGAKTGKDKRFSRGASINTAFEKSTGDIIVIGDSDTAVSELGLFGAISEVEKRKWTFPFDIYYALDEASTQMQLSWDPTAQLLMGVSYEHKFPNPTTNTPDCVSGCIVLTRDAFETTGGFDERFIGWGLEDLVFVMLLETYFGPQTRLTGLAYHLWHPRTHEENFGQPFFEHNRVLYHEWCALLGRQPSC